MNAKTTDRTTPVSEEINVVKLAALPELSDLPDNARTALLSRDFRGATLAWLDDVLTCDDDWLSFLLMHHLAFRFTGFREKDAGGV